MTCLRCAAAAAAALFTFVHAAQAQQASGPSWDVSAAAVHRRLVEKADDGRQLVEESGPMLRLALSGQLGLASGGALRAEAGLAGGDLDYDGRTQGGVPLRTETRHRDADLSIAWRPWAPANWGEAWFVLRTTWQRRDIAATPTVGGLLETSTLLMPGLRWSHAIDAQGWRWRPSAELRTSVWHRLDVDYRGVFDAQELDGGRRTELVLGLEASAAGSPWSWSLEWTHARQSASERDTVRSNGVPVGTVRQPRIEIDDVMLRARRAF